MWINEEKVPKVREVELMGLQTNGERKVEKYCGDCGQSQDPMTTVVMSLSIFQSDWPIEREDRIAYSAHKQACLARLKSVVPRQTRDG